MKWTKYDSARAWNRLSAAEKQADRALPWVERQKAERARREREEARREREEARRNNITRLPDGRCAACGADCGGRCFGYPKGY